MELNNSMYWFWMSGVTDIGIKGIDHLLGACGTIENIFEASASFLSTVEGISEKQVSSIVKNRNKEVIFEDYNKLKEKGIYFVTKNDVDYPSMLRDVFEAPFFLYYKGSLPIPSIPSIAIIGARNCTNYGRKMAQSISEELAYNNVQVISGLARGIDSYAHRGALDGCGKTFAVLGCGVDQCYPYENQLLFDEMLETGGVISEYSTGTKPLPFHFPMRNRIIAGLTNAILVVEARESSGTFITVDRGLEQGKDIYAIPGRIGDSLSSGCNRLIQNGAKLVRNIDDIMEEFRMKYQYFNIINSKNSKECNNPTTKIKKQNNKNIAKQRKKCEIILETDEKIVYDRLSLEPKHLEILLVETKLKYQQLICVLMSLELKNLITQWISNYYVRNE